MTLDAAVLSTLIARLERLEQQRQLHQAVVNTLPVACLYLDCHGTIHFANQGALRQLNCEPEDCLGQSLLSWLSPGDGERLLEELNNLDRNSDEDCPFFLQQFHLPGGGRATTQNLCLSSSEFLRESPHDFDALGAGSQAAGRRKGQQSGSRLISQSPGTTQSPATSCPSAAGYDF